MLKGTIPFVDLREKTPVDLLRAYPDKARDMVRAGKRAFGIWSQIASIPGLPLSDRLSRGWLERTKNPYLHEIETISEILRLRGIYTLNTAFEWGCTSGAFRNSETVSMLRILDWPFPDMGRHVVVAFQQGKAGTFYNVTWPGLSGVFTAMAPGRFSACINQAPMRMHNFGFVGDWIKNRRIAFKENGIPASHLLRQVMENAKTYGEAKEMLTGTPLAVPAIFVLAGAEFGQGCVIERLENLAETFELSADLRVTTSNHFNSTRFAARAKGWRPREADSAGRYRQSCTVSIGDLEQADFSWLQAPMLNSFTRLCVVADAGLNRLMVQGYAGNTATTERFCLPAISAQRQAV